MNKTNLKKLKRLFEEERKNLLFNDRVIREDFNVNADDRADEVDQASTDMLMSMGMRLRNRETLYIKKIEEAIKRIDEPNFGDCEECGEEIDIRRLLARPTTTLCISCKEEQEKKEGLSSAGLTSKSLGQTFSRKTG